LSPHYAIAQAWLAILLCARGRFDEALSVDPYHLALVHLGLGNVNEAMASFVDLTTRD
jgi:hypothetical protein